MKMLKRVVAVVVLMVIMAAVLKAEAEKANKEDKKSQKPPATQTQTEGEAKRQKSSEKGNQEAKPEDSNKSSGSNNNNKRKETVVVKGGSGEVGEKETNENEAPPSSSSSRTPTTDQSQTDRNQEKEEEKKDEEERETKEADGDKTTKGKEQETEAPETKKKGEEEEERRKATAGKGKMKDGKKDSDSDKKERPPVLRPPNVVILLADDLGVGDVGCYGNDTIKTPNIDSLARDGVRLTHHLTASALCSPSRAALLTGRYPARYGMEGDVNTPPVPVHVASRVGLPLDEITLAEALAAANYNTAAVGKWHLGMGCDTFGRDCSGPRRQGFHHFFGVPFTLDNSFESDQPFFYFPLDGSDSFYLILLTVALATPITLVWVCGRRWHFLMMLLLTLLFLSLSLTWFLYTHYRLHTEKWWQVSPWMNKHLNGILMEETKVVQQPLVLEGLSQRLASHSAGLIGRFAREDRPFFLYHSFVHVHQPMFTVPQMAGKSVHGRYGDNVEELDAAVGEILAALREHGLEDNTIVYFLSDNGGHLEALGPDGQRTGGHNGKFKGGKGMGAAEGGIRVPGIFRWPGHIPAGVTVQWPVSVLDTLPTILDLANLPPLHQLIPTQEKREVDGKSVADVLISGAFSPSRVLIHHCGKRIHALRFIYKSNVFKLHYAGYKWGPGSTQCGWGGGYCSCYDVEDYQHEPRLYNLFNDTYEDTPLPLDDSKYMQITSIMLQFVAEWKARIQYPPSMLESVSDTVLTPWLQPFRSLL